MQVLDVMVEDVKTVSRDATLMEAASLMRKHQVGSVVVVEKKDDGLVPVGMLTDRDLVIEVLAERIDGKNLTVDDVMSREIVTVFQLGGVLSAVQLMETGGVRRLPVVDKRGHLCGIVTADDINQKLVSAMTALSKVPVIQRAVEELQHWKS